MLTVVTKNSDFEFTMSLHTREAYYSSTREGKQSLPIWNMRANKCGSCSAGWVQVSIVCALWHETDGKRKQHHLSAQKPFALISTDRLNYFTSDTQNKRQTTMSITPQKSCES